MTTYGEGRKGEGLGPPSWMWHNLRGERHGTTATRTVCLQQVAAQRINLDDAVPARATFELIVADAQS